MQKVRAPIWLLLLSAAGVGTLWWWAHHEEPGPTPRGDAPAPGRVVAPAAPSSGSAFAPGEPPRLLAPREATAERPVLAWERLLAADGSPQEDIVALGDLVNGYLQSGLGAARRTIGFNEDLVPALSDAAALGEAALPAEHPAIREGRLIDRWGTPWQVHPLAGDSLQLRSAGPDRRLYTADDLVAPGDGAVP